jgi:L-ribulokinase
VEATAYGARRIIERFEEYGVKVDRIVNCGGIAEKNPMVMQIYADVTGRPIEIAASAQACALGAAIFGAVAGKAHADTLTAQSKMAGVKPVRFDPIPDHVKVYERLYSVYLDLHDAFGKTGRTPDLSQAMKTLIAIRRECR